MWVVWKAVTRASWKPTGSMNGLRKAAQGKMDYGFLCTVCHLTCIVLFFKISYNHMIV
jgi:hypothetical protein